MAAVQTDYSVLMTGQDSSNLLDGFGFLQFVQIFLLGDTRVLLSTVPRVSVDLLGQDGDIISDTRNSRVFLGDPVKNTMLLQSIRRFPIITSVPIIVTLVLLVVDVIKLINPMFHRVLAASPVLAPIMAPFLEDFIPHEERTENTDHEEVDPTHLPGSVAAGLESNSDYYNMEILKMEQFPIAMSGTMQSPVDLSSSNRGLEPIIFNYNIYTTSSAQHSVTNTGLSWEVKEPTNHQQSIYGGPLMTGNYILDHFDAHWGGSEHSIDGEEQDGELHLYHYNTQYSGWEEAVHYEASVAVVAVMLKVGEDNLNAEIDKIAGMLPNITFKGDSVQMEEQVDLMNLLPIDKDYLTYEGSLTTPDFNENVVWLVMRDPIMVSRHNIDSMKEMRYGGEDSLKMTNNCKKKVSLGQREFIGPTNSAARPEIVTDGSESNSDYYNMEILKVEQFPIAISSTMQSPVDISSVRAVLNRRLEPITFYYIGHSPDTLQPSVTNTGLSWEVKIPIPTNHQQAISGGPLLAGNYMLNHYTAHWGGSEHSIDGEEQDGELQLYHYHSQYHSWEEAVHHEAGVAVVAVLLKAGEGYLNMEIDKIVRMLPNVTFQGDSVQMEEQVDLMNLLPNDKDYFSYEGSLTTPDFNENVVWLVMRDPLIVSRESMNSMKQMRFGGEESNKMVNNCRKKVNLGHREVFRPVN